MNVSTTNQTASPAAMAFHDHFSRFANGFRTMYTSVMPQPAMVAPSMPWTQSRYCSTASGLASRPENIIDQAVENAE